MSHYVTAMWPGSLPEESPSASGRSSRLSSAAGSRSPRSSRSRSSVSSRWSSGSRSRPRRGSRSRSRSRSRRRHQRKYRRYSRSYSRSRSRSRSRRRYRERHYVSSRRYYRSPSPSPDRSRSRSRSRGRSYYRRAYAVTRGRRYYGFGRSVYPEEPRSWRARSRTRSRSPTPFRLSEKDRMELLEIAKANAAKALGTTNFELPPSLRIVPVVKETNHETVIPNKGAKFELSEKLTEGGTTNASEKSSQQKSSNFNVRIHLSPDPSKIGLRMSIHYVEFCFCWKAHCFCSDNSRPTKPLHRNLLHTFVLLLQATSINGLLTSNLHMSLNILISFSTPLL